MADTDDFASVDDLEASWHALTDEEKTRAKKLIAYASDLIRSYRRWDRSAASPVSASAALPLGAPWKPIPMALPPALAA